MSSEQKAVYDTLSLLLGTYVKERIIWLLNDVGERNSDDPKIQDSIQSFIDTQIAGVPYDDALIIAEKLKQSRRLSHSDNRSRRVIVEIIRMTMESMNLGNVRYKANDKKRTLQTIQ